MPPLLQLREKLNVTGCKTPGVPLLLWLECAADSLRHHGPDPVSSQARSLLTCTLAAIMNPSCDG